MQTLSSGNYRFGPFMLDTGAYRLVKDGAVVQVSPKIVDLLLYLVARPSVLVSKEELFRALWPDVAVTDNALTQAVSELRQALGDDPSSPKYVQTVASRRSWRMRPRATR
jgi:DNA-binding winged helix-turn-helix (wHTH) protein